MNNLQKCILNIFKEVKKICDKHKIPYYAIGGTCIGAIRHKGFIPWDDDLDIAIPIEYIETFLEKARKELPEYLEILPKNRNSTYFEPFFKIIDKNTTFIEEEDKKITDLYKGVFIDVMPISGIPVKFQKNFLYKLRKYMILDKIRKLPFKHQKRTNRKIEKIFLSIFNKFIPKDYFFNKYLSLLKKYPLKNSDYTGYVWAREIENLIFPTKLFLSGVEKKFENTTINCPVGYHKYLTEQFGDYMVLPPEDKREIHEGFIDLDHSYEEYKKYPEKVLNNIRL